MSIRISWFDVTCIQPVFFVGRLGDPSALAATSLAFSVAGVTGFSLMLSFVNGLATLGTFRV